MGKKIFVSYKYGDTSVQHLDRNSIWETTKVRDYVDEFQEKLADTDHINKGEKDGEDLSDFKNSTIESKLRKKIFDSSVTVVFISPNMKDYFIPESDQWIPWEISYSLRETTRNDRTSRRNGVLAVVLPDENGSYEYAIEKKSCCNTGCNLWHTNKFFWILRKNMFNQYQKTNADCDQGDDVYLDWPSYIHVVRWNAFIDNINYWVSKAEELQNYKANYDIKVNMPEDI